MTDPDYHAWQRANEAPTVYSEPLPARDPFGDPDPEDDDDPFNWTRAKAEGGRTNRWYDTGDTE